MFSWAGFIIIAVVLSLVIVVVRAIIDLAGWLIEVFVREPREMARIREIQKAKRRSPDAPGTPSSRRVPSLGALPIPPNTSFSSPTFQASLATPSAAEPHLARTPAAAIHASETEEDCRRDGGGEELSREKGINLGVNEERLT